MPLATALICSQDLQFRCAILVKAALEAPWLVPLGEDKRTYGEDNLVFIANDWHAALLPFYLQAHYRDHGKFTFARSCFVVHNMAHQGRGPMADLANLEVRRGDWVVPRARDWRVRQSDRRERGVRRPRATFALRRCHRTTRRSSACTTPSGAST